MFSNPRTLKWTGIGVTVVVVAIMLYLRLIQVKPYTDKDQENATEDSLEKARTTLRRTSDLSSCRAALQHLNAHLSGKAVNTPNLSSEERENLRREAGLTADDLAELEQTTFTLLDGLHLEAALLYRDAARSLTPRLEEITRTPEQEASALFAWTVRQVPLVPGTRFEGSDPLLPPELGLRRGIGSPMTRALLFLGLLDQRGLDGCLLSYPPEGGKSVRYWACGVRGSDNRIYLFDPSLGLPLPGRNGEGIATLDVVATKDYPKASHLDFPEQQYDLKPETVAGAEVHLVFPLSSLAPRQRYLEKEVLEASNGGRIAADLARRERFASVLKAVEHKGAVKIAPWAVRMQRSYYPPNEGGTAPPAIIKQFREDIWRQNIGPLWNAIPASIRARFEELPHSRKFVDVYSNRLGDFFLGAGQARDLQLRGDFMEATRTLGTANDQLQIILDTYRTNFDPDQVVQWYDLAFAATAGKAVSNTRGTEKMVFLMVEGASAESLLPHVAYLRALVKHEQAERIQYRFGDAASLEKKEDARELELVWKDARDIWDDYLFRNTTVSVSPEVIRKGKTLQARGQHMLAEASRARARLADEGEQPALEENARNESRKAADYWRDLTKERKDEATLGYRFLLKQLEGR